ncbi:MAG TPA: nitroreductase family protein [Micromonosporaceae bacterium]
MQHLTAGRFGPLPSEFCTASAPTVLDSWSPTELAAILGQRHAVRSFTAEPVRVDQVASIAACAYSADERLWPSHVHGDVGLSITVAARNVNGLPRGLHRIDRSGARSAIAGDDALLEALARDLADAPVLLLIGADLGSACARSESGYGAALVRCGSLGYAAWLAAIHAGLSGCAHGGSHPLVTAAYVADGRAGRHMFSISVGAAT